jgi:hypothetical protein
MDELDKIRRALEWANARYDETTMVLDALEALTNFESRALLGEPEIIERIRAMDRDPDSPGKFRYGTPYCGALIGQYAYRYSEGIQKERDYWKALAMDFHDAVHAEAEKQKGCEI